MSAEAIVIRCTAMLRWYIWTVTMSVNKQTAKNPFSFSGDSATTKMYTLSLHDALPILDDVDQEDPDRRGHDHIADRGEDRKSTRLNSSHVRISYAVFCLKKKIPHCLHRMPEALGPRPRPQAPEADVPREAGHRSLLPRV